MFGFGKSARVTELEGENASLEAENDELAYKLTSEKERAERIAGKLAEANKQAARVPNLEAENHRLTAELAKYKRGLSMGTQASAERRRKPAENGAAAH